jgi:uncharacterized protein (TIGR02569 family)
VLKPLDQPADAVAWQAETLASIDQHDAFRVSPPMPTQEGGWVADGWTAWRFEPGRHAPGRWEEIITAGNHFNRALALTGHPDWSRWRSDHWAIGDRVAWEELPAATHTGAPHLDRLAAARRPIPAPPQLIHGDLTGNVLFDDALPPLVIDLSPYWRPQQFATAIVIIDALVFHSAPATLIDALGNDPDRMQYLLRALIYRIVASHLADLSGIQTEDDPYLPVVCLLLDNIADRGAPPG